MFAVSAVTLGLLFSLNTEGGLASNPVLYPAGEEPEVSLASVNEVLTSTHPVYLPMLTQGEEPPASAPTKTATPTATSTTYVKPTSVPTTVTPTVVSTPYVNPTPVPTTATPTVVSTPYVDPTPVGTPVPSSDPIDVPILFLSRQIPTFGSVYYKETGSLPGVGPYTRLQVAAPGKLIVREPDGTLRTLVDGANPTQASMNLIDVNAPDVSYDGKKIVFAGLPTGTYEQGARNVMNNPGKWRIYTINVDGTDLKQITFSDRDDLDVSHLSAPAQFKRYDDTDPAWLPDGRIVFSSTRWPSFGQYGGSRTSNLYVMNADGSDMHRITAERNGADRPMVDPITGKIVYSRWWRNHHNGVNSMETIKDSEGGYEQHVGLTHNRSLASGIGNKNLQRNSWHLGTINPDGTDLVMWAATSSTFSKGEDINHAYGGAFTPDGVFYANYFPMRNMTEAAGFGGIRRYHRGFGIYESILGVTREGELVRETPQSFGVYKGPYAAEPEVLPDGRLLVSWAKDVQQDYGLYVVDSEGNNLALLYDNPGTTEIRARAIRPRPLPPIIPDKVKDNASLLPPSAEGPYDIDGTFTFEALNVYFNAPVDSGIVSAPTVGSAGSIRFYINHQRSENTGSFPQWDWPILLDELPVNPDGSVTNDKVPANVPLFEQLRTASDYSIPLTGRTFEDNQRNRYTGGAAHVAGLNFGRPGAVQTCVGCHTGHSMIPVPDDPAEALWSNLAPGAEVTVSSVHSNVGNNNMGLIDLRVQNGAQWDYWRSARGQDPNRQWVQLTFPVPVVVRTVRLYNPRPGEKATSDLQVQNATVKLYSDADGTVEVARATSGPLSVAGTDVAFAEVKAQVVRIETDIVTGTFFGDAVSSLAEIEVIARSE